MNSKQKSTRLAVLALFTALTIALQFLSYFVKIGNFSLSLVLIPIVLAGAMYGVKCGAFLGGVFGVITVIGCISGIDGGGNILFNASPLLTILVCMLKGILCGAASAAISNLLKAKSPTLAVVLAAAAAPIVNTGTFLIIMVLFFKDILYSWANGTNLASYIIVGLVGINFIIEFTINIVLSPAIMRVIKVLKK